jgi:hypothetical protein
MHKSKSAVYARLVGDILQIKLKNIPIADPSLFSPGVTHWLLTTDY